MPHFTYRRHNGDLRRLKRRAFDPQILCISLDTMCRECQEEFLPLREKYPSYILSGFLPPGIYPVIFRGKFLLSEVGLSYAVDLANKIETTLSEIMGVPIPVMAFSSFEMHPHDKEEIYVSILIQSPRSDADIIRHAFRVLRETDGFQCVLPTFRGCPNALFLSWHRDPMRGFTAQKRNATEQTPFTEAFTEANNVQFSSRIKPRPPPLFSNAAPMKKFHSCLYGTGCTDHAIMCDYCWMQFESGKSPTSSAINVCTSLDTMCDYCWRAYETASVQEAVVGKDDPCISPLTQCDGCRRMRNALKENIPQSYLLPAPGTYPVKFIRRFRPEDGVTKNTIEDLTKHIMENASKRFSEHVRVHAFSITPRHDKGPAAAWVLVDFPEFVEIDIDMKSILFDTLPGESERWIAKTPRNQQCLSFFRLAWWWTKMEFHKFHKLPVLT
ncbi:hypothetical protein BDV06DRAFT_226148 [Aspergillus oleicola]